MYAQNALLARMTQIRAEIAAADAPHTGRTYQTPSWAIRSDLVGSDLHKAVEAALMPRQADETNYEAPHAPYCVLGPYHFGLCASREALSDSPFN